MWGLTKGFRRGEGDLTGSGSAHRLIGHRKKQSPWPNGVIPQDQPITWWLVFVVLFGRGIRLRFFVFFRVFRVFSIFSIFRVLGLFRAALTFGGGRRLTR